MIMSADKKGEGSVQLYDMHSHILPEFDDGAKSVEESLSLLDCLKKQGVSNVCLTPHFYSYEMSVSDFAQKRDDAFERFKPSLPDDMNIIVGAEVFVTKYLFVNDDLSPLTYGNSNYILTEHGYGARFSDHTMGYILNLVEGHGLTPVLPHVERYPTLMNDPSVIRELKDMGVIIQTNVSNYTKKGKFFKKRKLLKLIDDGLIDIIGTDAHSFSHNSPEFYTEALDCISQKCGEDTTEAMMKNAEQIFESAL